MPVARRPAPVTLVAASTLALACHLAPYTDSDSKGSSSTSGAATSAGTTGTPTTDAPTTSAGGTSTTTTAGGSDIGGMGGQCSLFMQDCPQGQKCTAWNEDGGIFPNGTRCVPVDPNPANPGEDCIVDGSFGNGLDNCDRGSLCLDLDNDGKATCVAYCTGTMDNPMCPDPTEQRCSFLFEPTVPLCFSHCDPLIQDCAMGESCVPNIAALGAPYFVCMPRVFPDIPGKYGDSCYALSGCDPGYLCIFAENLPTCKTVYCCSVWCDLTANDPCSQYDPTLTCVPWFMPGQETPGYENVGVCGIMQ